MTFSNKFLVRKELKSAATRPNGVSARTTILTLLNTMPAVEIDFEGLVVTPSFADEFVGGLFEQLGEAAFRSRIRLVGISNEARPLITHVISKHLKSPLARQ